MPYADRKDAGQRLADEIEKRAYLAPLILALPRGGVPVAFEIAARLKAPLDTIAVRKIGAPLNPEWAVGALAPHGIVLLDEDSMKSASISRAAVEGVIGKERAELERRSDAYKSGTFSAGFVPKTVVLVDDGIATGLTARAGLQAARARYPKATLVFATPLALGDSGAEIAKDADEIVVLERPSDIYAIGAAYERFEQVSDAEVLELLKSAQGLLKH